jgi:glycosyltransferase involved in cell wall biosynthesis
LIEAAKQIHAQIPSFRLVVLGGGSEAALVEHAAQEGWICFPGATFGAQKALWFRLAHFVLNPALVGLAILDAFCAGLPLIASSLPGHGPEIDYLEDNGNGLMAPNSPETYAATVVDLINDPEMRKRLSTGAMASADRYSMEQMVANFREGIHRCLNA